MFHVSTRPLLSSPSRRRPSVFTTADQLESRWGRVILDSADAQGCRHCPAPLPALPFAASAPPRPPTPTYRHRHRPRPRMNVRCRRSFARRLSSADLASSAGSALSLHLQIDMCVPDFCSPGAPNTGIQATPTARKPGVHRPISSSSNGPLHAAAPFTPYLTDAGVFVRRTSSCSLPHSAAKRPAEPTASAESASA